MLILLGLLLGTFSFLAATSYGDNKSKTMHIKFSSVNISVTSSFYVCLNQFVSSWDTFKVLSYLNLAGVLFTCLFNTVHSVFFVHVMGIWKVKALHLSFLSST